MDLAVQIINFNTKGHLAPCLSSVVAALGRSALDARVLVLENGSEDDLSDLAGRFGDAVELHESAVNLGFGGGQNLLSRTTRSRFLCFVNPDVVMAGGAHVLGAPLCVFAALLAGFAAPAVAAVGPMLVGADGAPQRWDHGELSGARAWISNHAGEA